MKIPVSEPLLNETERQYLLSAFDSGSISGTHGEYIERFEKEFSRYSNCSFGVSTNSGTSALHLAVASLGIGKGDDVLVSSFTNMATFFAVLYQGARPIPLEIEPDTWNVDPGKIKHKVTGNTKAILVVHIYGHPVNMDPVLEIARSRGLHVIEDCCEAHGALYKGGKVGSLGDVGCFSFYANKIITTGEGGMLTTNNVEIAERARSLRALAFGVDNRFQHRDIGFGYRMTNLQAAIGCAQMLKIEDFIKRKRDIAFYYNHRLKEVPGLQLPIEKSYARNVYWVYHMVLRREFGLQREVFRRRLEALGVETREAFTPYNKQEIFLRRGWVNEDECPVANYVGANGLYLPSSPKLKKEEQDYVIDAIFDAKKKQAQWNPSACSY